MRKISKLAPLALALPLALPFVGTAYAADGSTSANLDALNGSGASGTGMVTVNGNRLAVTINASGLLAGAPHAQHIHFGAQAAHECPTPAADKNGDGRITTTEGGPAYGPVQASLTTTGDTSAKSVLAVDRFPTAPNGTQNYSRTIAVSADLAQAVADGEAVLVVHGVDENGSGKYDGDAKSDLNASLPAEATDPALCGVLVAAPAGGASTGAGGAAGGSTDAGLLGVGGALLLAAAGTGAVAVRRSHR